jgi:hypothetical protein
MLAGGGASGVAWWAVMSGGHAEFKTSALRCLHRFSIRALPSSSGPPSCDGLGIESDRNDTIFF